MAALRSHLQKEQAYVEYLKTAVQSAATTGPRKESQGPGGAADWQMAPPKATNQQPAHTGANFELLRRCFQGCHLHYAPSDQDQHHIVGPSL